MLKLLCPILLLGTIIVGISAVGNAQEPAGTPRSPEFRVFFGTNQGIYTAIFNVSSGNLSPANVATADVKPSFLAIHPTGNFLYSVCEIDGADGKKTGGVASFSIDHKGGKLTLLNQQSSEGRGPCHVSVDKQGKALFVANYGSGSCASYQIDKDHKLMPAASAHQHHGKSVDPRRQEGPHAHSINLDPNNRFAFVCDLGLDQILIYKLDAESGKLTPHDPPFVKTPSAGGVRHFAFHPSGKYAFANNEMASTLTVYLYDAEKGKLNQGMTLSTLPGESPGNSTAETQVHPSGKFVYVSNRGHDSIAIFEFDASLARLKASGHQPSGGKTPRNFCIDPTGQFLLAANQGSGNVVVFTIDQNTGALKPNGQEIKVPGPACVKFVP